MRMGPTDDWDMLEPMGGSMPQNVPTILVSILLAGTLRIHQFRVYLSMMGDI